MKIDENPLRLIAPGSSKNSTQIILDKNLFFYFSSIFTLEITWYAGGSHRPMGRAFSAHVIKGGAQFIIA
jgi:hypothetical protein